MSSNEAKIFLPERPPAPRWPFALAAMAIAIGVAVLVFFFSRDESGGTVSVPKTTDTTPIPKISSTIVPAPSTTTTTTAPIAPPSPALDARTTIAALDDHLLLHLPFTSSLSDHSPRHQPLESSGTVEVHDGAAQFPGNSFLTLPHIALNNRAFAFSVWIKPEGKVAGYGLLEQVDGGPGKHLHILLRDPDKPYIGFYLNDLRAPQSINEASGWTHLFVQFTGSHQQIWIGGQLVIERLSDPFLGERGETRIGKAPMWNNVPTQCFKGAMRDLRLYDIALTPDHIRLLAGLEAAAPPLLKKPNETF